MSACECRFFDCCKCCIFVLMSSSFIFFQLQCCFTACEALSRLNWVEIERWSESFSRLLFTQQLITCCSKLAELNMRSTVNVWFLTFHMTVPGGVRSQRSASLTMWSSLSAMLCLMKHCDSSQIEWWRLKSFSRICFSDLLSSCGSLKMGDFWLMWV